MGKYRVGFARVDITPMESVPLAGFGSSSRRMSKCVRDPLYASCFAITDEADTTVILMTLDLQRADYETSDTCRPIISKLTGVPVERIILCGTHTHAGPDLFNDAEPSIGRYKAYIYERIPLCAAMAMSDRREAEIYMGDVEAVGFNFVKHYWGVHKDTGERISVGDNMNDGMYTELLGHTTQSDPTLHLLRIVRENCRDLVIANFRAHGLLCSGTKIFDVSADWMGGLRSAFEARTNGILAYFQGASGNQNPHSRIREEEHTRDCVAYGRLLTQKVLEGLEHMTRVEPAPIKTKQVMFPAKINRPTPERMELANEVNRFLAETGDRDTALKMARERGFSSYHHCYTVGVSMQGQPEEEALELNAVTMGELAFVSAPCELFDTLSVYVEDNAPYKKVVTLGYANGIVGYIPSAYAFEYRCYETDVCMFTPGIGEQMRDTFLEMLRELKD